MSRRPFVKPQSSLIVESLEDRRVLSTLGGLIGVPAAASDVISATSQLAADVTEPVRSQQGPPQQVVERLLNQLPEHVIAKHPWVSELVDTPSVPDPIDDLPGHGNSGSGNSGNGNSGNGNSGNGNSGNGNPGSGNSGNGNTGNPTRPSTPTLPPVTPPRGAEPGAVDAPATPATPPGGEDPEVAAPSESATLTFTLEAAAAKAADAAVAPPVAAGTNQPGGVSTDRTSAEFGASTRLVEATTDAGVRPTAEAVLAEEAATAELLQQIADLNATPAATAPGDLQGADLAALTGGGIDLRALDEALRQALVTVERAGQAVAQTVAQPGVTTWVAGALGALLAVEGLRRGVRRRRARLAGALADDPALTWVPGMPGSFSIEDA